MRRLIPAALLASTAFAAVTSVRIIDRTEVLDSRPMGNAGPYERIAAKANFAVDPALPGNRIISDIALAPRNARGLVEFSADLYVLKPRDPARGNGTVLFEITNRGNKSLARGLPPGAAPADTFLLERGFTLVWLGWEFDIADNPALLRFYAPIVAGLAGPVRSNFVVDHGQASFRFAGAYPVAEPASLAVTVRAHVDETPVAVPHRLWKLEGADTLMLDGGFEPGKIYEVVYQAKDPVMAGLGLAGLRDFVSFLKYGGIDTALSDEHRYVKRIIGIGSSQTGRLLRTYLYEGFNADEKGRRAFDGVIAQVAGAARGNFNHRFVQPTRTSFTMMGFHLPADLFPFTDSTVDDPMTGRSDGLLRAAAAANVTPRIFYINGANEYWSRAAALIHAMPTGKADAPLPPTTRVYSVAGTPHGSGRFPPARSAYLQLMGNPNGYSDVLTALYLAMHAWLKDGKEPPASRYPRIAGGQLVATSDVRFPRIPGVTLPTRPYRVFHLDFGRGFGASGIITLEPPQVGRPYPTLVSQVDADGNELAGIRMPVVAVPLATFTGWNLRSPEIGAPDEMFNQAGAWIPFAATKAERQRSRDPRLSVEERYQGRDEYLARARAAAEGLVKDGFLLDRDLPKVLARSEAEWDLVMKH